MIQISEAQWDLYRQRYEKLIWTIARKISGDEMTASFEDNVADLTVSAMNSIDAYCRKEGFTVDQALKDPGFDKYTKTVLWNYKCKKGVPLTKRMPFRNKHISIDGMPNTDEGKSFDIEDTKLSTSSSFILDDMFENIDFDTQKILKAIIEDPNVLSPDGALRLASLTKPTGLSIHSVRTGVGKIKRILEKTYVRD
jgi:hypothetical protein